jgi:hypothetical protein
MVCILLPHPKRGTRTENQKVVIQFDGTKEMQRLCLSALVTAQHGRIEKKAPTGTAHTAIDQWGLDGGVRASILTLNMPRLDFTITQLVI